MSFEPRLLDLTLNSSTTYESSSLTSISHATHLIKAFKLGLGSVLRFQVREGRVYDLENLREHVVTWNLIVSQHLGSHLSRRWFVIWSRIEFWNLLIAVAQCNLIDLEFRPDHLLSSSATLLFQFVACDSSSWLVQLLRFSSSTGIRFDSSCIDLVGFTIRPLSLSFDSNLKLVINHTTT